MRAGFAETDLPVGPEPDMRVILPEVVYHGGGEFRPHAEVPWLLPDDREIHRRSVLS